MGICGGFQMLGRKVSDPDGIEGNVRDVAGLGLLDIETIMEPAKTVRNVNAHSLIFGVDMTGYEIHLGKTQGSDCNRPFSRIDGHADGAISPDGRIIGTYLHGVFANDVFRHRYLETFGIDGSVGNYREGVDEALDRIALRLDALIGPEFPGINQLKNG